MEWYMIIKWKWKWIQWKQNEMELNIVGKWKWIIPNENYGNDDSLAKPPQCKHKVGPQANCWEPVM